MSESIDLIVSDGLSGGRAWATYRRKPNGSLARVKSPRLPLRATREEAEHDLDLWLSNRVYDGAFARLRQSGCTLPEDLPGDHAEEVDQMAVAEHSAPNTTEPYTIDALPIDRIQVVAGNNPREAFAEDKLQELAESIREHGVLQPLVVRRSKSPPIDQAMLAESRRHHVDDGLQRELVQRDLETVVKAGGRAYVHHVSYACDREVYRDEGLKMGYDVEFGEQEGLASSVLVTLRPIGEPRYQLVAGERRLRAAKLAGLTTVPVRVVDVADDQVLRLSLEENLRREDLNPIEQARALARLNRELGVKQSEIAAAIHSSQPAVANKMRLLELPEDVQARIISGELSEAHGVALARFKEHPKVASELAELAIANRYTSKQLDDGLPYAWDLERASAVKSLYLAPFDRKACAQCTHYRAKSGGYCLEPSCYEAKVAEAKAAKEAAVAKAVEEARAAGDKLPTTQQLGHESYDYKSLRYSSAPEGCKGEACEKRIQALDEYSQADDKRIWVCTDLKCWKRLEAAATRSANKAKKADVEAKLKRIAELCAKLDHVDALGVEADIGRRELAVLAAYAVKAVSSSALEEACKAAGIDSRAAWQGKSQVAWFAGLPRNTIVRVALEAILRYEQTERLKEFTSAGTYASDYYLEG